MATPPPLFATVIYVRTAGNVLAAVSSPILEPTLEDLTVEEHVRVRFPGTPGFVNVPISLLKAVRVTVTTDMLDRPQHYLFDVDNPSLNPGAGPAFNRATSDGAKGKKAIEVWQTASESIVSRGLMGDTLPGPLPPGGTHRLLVYEGGPLHLDTSGDLG